MEKNLLNSKKVGLKDMKLLLEVAKMTNEEFEYLMSLMSEEEKLELINLINEKSNKIYTKDDMSRNVYVNYSKETETPKSMTRKSFLTLALNDSDLDTIPKIKAFELHEIFHNASEFNASSTYALESNWPDGFIARDFDTDEEHVKCFRTYLDVANMYTKQQKPSSKTK
jgi:hypothetical protein